MAVSRPITPAPTTTTRIGITGRPRRRRRRHTGGQRRRRERPDLGHVECPGSEYPVETAVLPRRLGEVDEYRSGERKQRLDLKEEVTPRRWLLVDAHAVEAVGVPGQPADLDEDRVR